jgi:hypothetical protein
MRVRKKAQDPYKGILLIEVFIMGRLNGTVYAANPKGFFFICTTPQERFFLHITEFKERRLPRVGDLVTFEFAPPQKAGQLPCAKNVQLVGAL